MTEKRIAPNTVRFYIEGPKITADDFRRCVRNFLDLLNEVTADVSGKRKAVEWIISVAPGSIGLLATPRPTNGDSSIAKRIAHSIRDGVSQVSKRRPPEHFSDQALERLSELSSVVGLGNRGVSSIRMGVGRRVSEVSPKSMAYVDELLGTPTKAYGTVEGQLLALELSGRLHFGIDETLTGKRVKCYFGEEVYNDVIKSLKQRVAAYGLISYRQDGVPKSIEIERIHAFPDDSKLPKFKDIIGLFAE